MNDPPKPQHGRKFGLLATSLTKARPPKGDMEALTAVRDELDAVLKKSSYCENTPFSWVTLSIRYGLKEESKPHYQAINKKYGDLPLAIEVPTEEMEGASLDELKQLFRRAALRALIHAGEKHGRPVDELKAMLAA